MNCALEEIIRARQVSPEFRSALAKALSRPKIETYEEHCREDFGAEDPTPTYPKRFQVFQGGRS